jgi:mycothiol synthase
VANESISPPPGYTVRPGTWEDLPAVAGLLRAADTAVWGRPNTTEEEIGDTWSVPGVDLASDTWLVWSEGVLCGYAWLMARADHCELDGWGAVHPDHQRRGLGSFLLDAVEARSADHVALAPLARPVVHRTDVAAPDRPAHDLYERRGFSIDRHLWRMDMDIAPNGLREPSWPHGIEVRTLVPGRDERAVHAAYEEAFANQYAHVPWSFGDWVALRIRGEGFDPTLWFLAVDGEEIVGVLAGRIIDDVGWVETVGVREPWRGNGIGEGLLRRAFAEFHRRGMRRSSLYVDAQNETGATVLYERVGMSVASQYDIYMKQLRGGTKNEESLRAEA